MKHLTALIIILCSICSTYAQKELAIAPLFEGKGKWNLRFSGTYIKGKMLKEYDLTMFRSITTGDSSLFEDIEQTIEKDATQAIDKECGYINGKLYYGFYVLPPQKEQYRYIFYRNSSLRDDEKDEITIVYMEGYPTLKELKKMFQQ